MWLTLIEGLLCARHYLQCFSPTILCNLHTYPLRESITIISVLHMGHRVVKGLTQRPTSERMAEVG